MGKSPSIISTAAVGSAKMRKTTKMKLSFREKFRNWLFREEYTKATPYYEEVVSTRPNFDGGMNFTIHKASGGLVVNVHFYDNVRDRSESNLYVIPEDEQIGENLSKILTMENLKR